MKGDLKICSRCHQAKNPDVDFYMCAGRRRSECKECTVKKNVRYQKQNKSWKHRGGDDESRKLYMREYYAQHKDQFAQYREEFKNKHPDYYKDYFRNRKEKS